MDRCASRHYHLQTVCGACEKGVQSQQGLELFESNVSEMLGEGVRRDTITYKQSAIGAGEKGVQSQQGLELFESNVSEVLGEAVRRDTITYKQVCYRCL